MARVEYTQSVVQTRVYEKELLSIEVFEQMIEAESVDELMAILNTSIYANFLTDFNPSHEYENLLKLFLKNEYRKIKEIAVCKDHIKILLLGYDFFNVKVALKEFFSGADFSHLYSSLGNLSIEEIQAFIKEEKGTNLPDSIKKAISDTKKDFRKTKDPQRLEILIDKFFIESFYQQAIQQEIPLLQEYIKAKIDFINLLTVFRVKEQEKDLEFLKLALLKDGNIEVETLTYFLYDSIQNILQKLRKQSHAYYFLKGLENYGQDKSLTPLERERDNCLLEIIDQAKNIHFGPEPLIAYLLKRENEVKMLRMLILSKLNNIKQAKINKRMRSIYV